MPDTRPDSSGRRPRLCMVVHGPYPVGEPRVAREAAAAYEAGFDVDVVAMGRQREPSRERVGPCDVVRLPLEHRRGGGIRAVVVEYVTFTALATAAVARLHRRRRYDIVQVHNPPDFLVAAAVLPRLTGARVIFDVHDLASDMMSMRFAGRRWLPLARRALLLIERLAARVADAVLTVHEPYRRELVERGIPAAKITVVMNTVDESLLPPPRRARNSGFRVAYHGTLTEHYGVDLLLEAVAGIVPDVPAVAVDIYGEGDALPELRLLADRLGIADRVTFSGCYLPIDTVLRRVRDADAAVIPNRPTSLNRFALSSKLFEYIALGVPAVVAGLPTLREHFADDEVMFFEPGNPDSLAQALRGLAADREAAVGLAARARRRYETYRWPEQAARYVAVLRRTLTERPVGSSLLGRRSR